MKHILKTGTALTLLAISGMVMADVQLKTSAQIEVTVVNKQGKKSVMLKPANRVVPGKEVIYTITAKNTGKQSADKVVIKNPVPKNTVYVDGSAFGKHVNISFSVDGGKTYAKPEQLKVTGSDGKSRHAVATDFTNLRWILRGKLKPGATAVVGYRVKVK